MRYIARLVVAVSCALCTLYAAGQKPSDRCTPPYEGAGATAASPDAHVPGTAIVSCAKYGDGVQWRITRPEVRQRITAYEMIIFRPGDVVTVAVKGCVHNGKDWKPLWGPEGAGTDRLYHGTIWVPGARVRRRDGADVAIPVGTGLVRIGGVASRLDAEKPYTSEALVIGDTRVGDYLRLGYEDEYYEDNGYPGTPSGDHCEGSSGGIATVVITITPGSADFARRLLSFDPVSSEYDENGILFAPRWFGYNLNSSSPKQLSALGECSNFPYKHPVRVTYGIESRCAAENSFDVPTVFTQCLLEPALGELHGHVNWTPATFVGLLDFYDFSPDKDLDFKVYDFPSEPKKPRLGNFSPGSTPSPIHSILTDDSQSDGSEYKDSLQLEFAGYELSEYFSHADWNLFRYHEYHHVGMKASHYDDELQRKFYRKTAVVTGLLGLDCVHDCHVELHPVYAMAIRTRYECKRIVTDEDRKRAPKDHKPLVGTCADDAANPMVGTDDAWMIFVRNAGNEGSCAQDVHYLDRDTVTLLLPAPPGAVNSTPVVRKGSEFFSNVENLSWTVKPDTARHAVKVTFSLHPASCSLNQGGQQVRIHGAVHFNWTDSDDSEVALEPEVVGSAGSHKSARASESPAKIAEEPPSTGDSIEVAQVKTGANIDVPDCVVNSHTREEDITTHNREFDHEQINFAELRKTKGRSPGSAIFKMLAGYFHENLGAFADFEQLVSARDFLLTVGGRSELIQTPLGSIETEVSTSFPRNVLSRTGQEVQLHITNWLTGLRVQFARSSAPFIDLKGGMMWRSSDEPVATIPEFRHFRGHDDVAYTGIGFEPGRESHRISVRISAGVMFVPGTGEKMVRITAGPQFRRRK